MNTDEVFVIRINERSEWRCELFGMKDAITYNPVDGNVPNWFWRTMQYLILGCKWIKDER